MVKNFRQHICATMYSKWNTNYVNVTEEHCLKVNENKTVDDL